jgi:formate hydrogenlyase transcriptional activator
VHENQRSLVIQDVEDETRFRPAMQRLQSAALRSVCAVLLSTSRRQFGSIVLASRSSARTVPRMSGFCRSAAQIALAMDAANNFHDSQHAEERLRLLLDLRNRIVSNLDLRALLREVSASIRHVMHCEGAAVSLPDHETGELRLVALDSPDSKGILREGLASGDLTNSAARVFATG